jgi:hypothetical protein
MDAQVCVIGAGPAGLMAAISSATAGARTAVVDANTAAGRKLLLTGGGRCNFTHDATPDKLIRVIGAGGRFLSYAFHKYPPAWVRDFFRQHGLESMVDQAGCVFPVIQRASDVRDVLVRQAEQLGVRFYYGKRIESVKRQADSFVVSAAGDVSIQSDKVIIATGGVTWPKTGSTGDGYKFAQAFGHTIIPPRPSLVPLVSRETWPAKLAGTAIDNVGIAATVAGSKIVTTGAMIFTDDGIGGPAVLDISRFLTNYLPNEKEPIGVSIDLAPEVVKDDLERRLIDRLAANPSRKIASVLGDIAPARLAKIMCEQAGCAEVQACQLTKDMRKKLVRLIKALPLFITATRPIEEATVTRGGVSTDQIDPKTMQSKTCPGLFFAGEILDVDGPCGGYNLQICWSTGALAGICSV